MKIFFPIFLLISLCGYSNENLYEVSLTEKTASSLLIVEGKVTGRESFWNSGHTMIYTRNTVQVYTVFKGAIQGQTITIVTEGGRVGNQVVSTSSLLELDPQSDGMFFLVQDPSNAAYYRVFSERQGFIVYSPDESTAVCPFYETTCELHRKAVLDLLGKKKARVKGIKPLTGTAKSLNVLSFSPQTLTAGTQTELTINGTDFGTAGPSATAYVEFTDANNGNAATYYQPDLNEYVSWTNTQIKVRVPSRAGTGIFRVYVNGVLTQSSTPLTVNYSLLTASNMYRLRLINDNGTGGSTWRYSTNTLASHRDAFIRAMNTWKCVSGIAWTMGSITTTTTAINGDGINVFSMSSTLPTGVLGVCYNYMSSCNGTDWHLFEQDILFRSSGANWNFTTALPTSSQMDFESVAFHELGHAHLLGHVNDGNDVMYFSIGNGTARRSPTPYNTFAANHVMNFSTSGPLCSQPVMVANFPSGCNPSSSTDAQVSGSALNPSGTVCFGAQNFYVSLENVASTPISSVEFQWSVNNVLQAPFTWSGTLPNGASQADILIGAASINAVSNVVKIWANLVNGQQEIVQSNDTITLNVQASPCTNNNAGITAIQVPNNAVCPGVTDNIYVTLTNYGINPLTSCRIYLSQNGAAADTVQWTGTILPGQSLANVYAGELAFYNGSYTISAQTALPNGSADTWTWNDSMAVSYTPKFCPHNDIGITSMNQLTPGMCPGNTPFTVCMTNFGIDVLTSCTIHLKVNGTELITYPWSGTLLPDSTVLCGINLGTVNLNDPQNQIQVYTSLPNGSADERTANDLIQQLYAPTHLAGTYTIGGANPDFATLTAAANYLNTQGICGDVTFNMRSGTYQDLFSLQAIPSFNGEHTVVFQSEAGNADSVIVNRLYSTSFPYNTLVIDGSKNVVFRNLTFVNMPMQNSYPGFVTTIVLKGPLKNIRFEGNKIYNLSQNVNSVIYGVDIQTGSADPNVGYLVFDNNLFNGGTHAIYCSPSSDRANHLLLNNNRFIGQVSSNVNIRNAGNVRITNNYFEKVLQYYEALSLQYITDTLQVLNNEFFDQITGDVINIANAAGTASNHSLIANNLIRHQATLQSWVPHSSINISECGYLDFVHNTIDHINATPSNESYVFRFGTGISNLRLLNNLVQRSGSGAIYNGNTLPGTLNYNDLAYNTGYVAMVNGTMINDLATFQATQLKEVNSVAINPGFVGASFLPNNAALDNLGTPFPAVSTDKNGSARNSTTPDIGAYEFTKFNYDIGISALSSDQNACGDSLELTVSVSNYGLQSINGFTVQVQINDSVYAPQSFTQSIASDATLSNLFLGNFSLARAQANTVMVRTLLPNGVTDQYVLNDSLADESVNPPLNGVYTVGTSAADFLTLLDAFAYLNVHGVCGPTVLNIKAGTYIGQHLLSQVPGLSSVNTLLIQSEDQDSMAVTLEYIYHYQSQSQMRYLIKLDEVEYVTIKHLRFAPFGGNTGNPNGIFDEAIQLTETSEITVANCHFSNGDILGSESNRTYVRNNLFLDGDYTSLDGDSVFVENNQFHVGSVQVYNAVGVKIEGNTFIAAPYPAALSTVKLQNSITIQVVRNNFRSTTLSVESCGANPNAPEEQLIANNFFGSTLNMGSSGFHVINNSFNLVNTYAMTTYLSFGSVRNNIFSTGTSPIYGFDAQGNYSSGIYNNNVISSSSPNMATIWGSNPVQISRQQWLSGGKDANSIYDVSPNYADPAINDLHTNSPVFDGAGIPISYITNDYDNEVRPIAAIDIGADQFEIDSSQFFDLELYRILSPDQTVCTQADSLKLRIVNHSNFAIDSFKVETISYDFSYGIQSFTVHIPANDTIDLTTSAYHFVPNTGYQLKFVLSQPNGQQDDILSNDSKTSNYTFLEPVTIYERTDPYCGARELFIDEFPLSSILWSTGATSDRITITAPGTYSVTVTGQGGCQVTGTIQIN